MPPRILLSLHGDFIPFHIFTSAISDLSDILYEVDLSLSGRETIQWGIRSLRSKDKAIEAIPRVLHKDCADKSSIIVPTVLRGMRLIRQKAMRPDHFSDDALVSAKDLSMVMNGFVRKIAITGSVNGHLGRPVFLNSQVALHVEKVIGPRYTTLGSVEGTLEMISVRRYSQFGIRHSLTDRSIKCRFDDEMLEKVKAALGKRVIAEGIVHYNAQHEPVRVDVEWIRTFDQESELPSIEDIGGSDPDFTEGMTTEDYLRSIRG